MSSEVVTRDAKARAFVRITAWSMVVLAVVCGLLAILLSLLVGYLMHLEILDFMLEAPELAQAPVWLKALFGNLLPLSLLLLALSLVTLWSGFALLARRPWALWFSIAMFWLGAIGNLVGIVVHAWLLHNFRAHMAGLPEWVIQLMAANYWSAQLSGALFGLVFAAGFGWTALKLQSAAVRAEFSSLAP